MLLCHWVNKCDSEHSCDELPNGIQGAFHTDSIVHCKSLGPATPTHDDIWKMDTFQIAYCTPRRAPNGKATFLANTGECRISNAWFSSYTTELAILEPIFQNSRWQRRDPKQQRSNMLIGVATSLGSGNDSRPWTATSFGSTHKQFSRGIGGPQLAKLITRVTTSCDLL